MVNWKFKHDIGDIEKLVKQIGERGRGRVYGVFGTGELSTVMRLYFSGTGEKVADLGALWNLREQAGLCLSYRIRGGILSWKSKRFKVRQVDPMRESLKLGSCGSYKNYFKGALPFRGKG